MRRQRGSVFVYSLAVLVALIGVLAAVASTERVDVKAAANRKEKLKARMACMAAIQRFIAVEANDLLGGGATTTGGSSASTSTTAQQTGATTQQDSWALLGSNGDENVVVDDTSFRMQVLDACSFVNLSQLIPTAQIGPGTTITSTNAPWLVNMPLSQQQVDAFVDFTTSGPNATADGGKDAYYNGLTNPYKAKEAPLDTLDELLQIRYFNAAAIYQPNTNIVSTVTYTAGSSGQQPTIYDLVTPYSYSPNMQPGPLGQQQARTRIALPINAQNIAPYRTSGRFTAPGIAALQRLTPGMRLSQIVNAMPSIQDKRAILDFYTVYTGTKVSGLINLNTASQNVIASMPGMTPDIAQALVQQQQTGYTKLSDVLNVAGYTGNVLTQTIDHFCVQSSTFIVRVIGSCGSASVAMEATVDIISNKPRLIRIADVPFTDAIGRWNWNSTTSTETVLKEGS